MSPPPPDPEHEQEQEQEQEWFADGLRFACTQCGNCCTGPPGTVWFDDDEAARMAASFGLDVEAFRARYARRIGRRWSLKEHRTSQGYDCIFLDRQSVEGRAVCSIYETRPRQCRTWPFWPENLASRRAWAGAKRRTPCPGMDNGSFVPVERIRILRDETRQ